MKHSVKLVLLTLSCLVATNNLILASSSSKAVSLPSASQLFSPDYMRSLWSSATAFATSQDVQFWKNLGLYAGLPVLGLFIAYQWFKTPSRIQEVIEVHNGGSLVSDDLIPNTFITNNKGIIELLRKDPNVIKEEVLANEIIKSHFPNVGKLIKFTFKNNTRPSVAEIEKTNVLIQQHKSNPNKLINSVLDDGKSFYWITNEMETISKIKPMKDVHALPLARVTSSSRPVLYKFILKEYSPQKVAEILGS